jgi:hypothetical protein
VYSNCKSGTPTTAQLDKVEDGKVEVVDDFSLKSSYVILPEVKG